jgi:hypothetical protein
MRWDRDLSAINLAISDWIRHRILGHWILGHTQFPPRSPEQFLGLIGAAVFMAKRSVQRGLHQGQLMIIKKLIQVQCAVSPMRERNCLSVEEAHLGGLSIDPIW